MGRVYRALDTRLQRRRLESILLVRWRMGGFFRRRQTEESAAIRRRGAGAGRCGVKPRRSWSRDNTIVFAPTNLGGQSKMSAEGVDIWTVDLKNRGTSRLTLAPGSESFPVWSPDGARLYYLSNPRGGGGAVAKRADGTGPEEVISTSAFLPTTVSPDGHVVAGRVITTTDFDVATIDLVKKSPPLPYAAPLQRGAAANVVQRA